MAKRPAEALAGLVLAFTVCATAAEDPPPPPALLELLGIVTAEDERWLDAELSATLAEAPEEDRDEP